MSLSSFQKSASEVLQACKGNDISHVPTPHLIIDRRVYVNNCERMADAVEKLGWSFRAHIKTHKTVPGTKLQCETTRTGMIIASTIPEIKAVLDGGMVSSGLVKDILFSMPFPIKSFEILSSLRAEMQKHRATLRLLMDHPGQIQALERLLEAEGRETEAWSIFLKLDVGTHRAGLPIDSTGFVDLVKAAFSSPNVRLFGTYSHAGHSYAAKSTVSAAEYLALEVSSVNKAAKLVMQIASELNVDKNNKLGDPASDGKLTLAVGATPTAHAAQTKEEWASIRSKHSITEDQLVGHIELHAGCYTLLDMQQFATGCISMSDCALRVGANIISIYPDRREVLCDAGGLAMSKDTGPIPGFGPVVFSEGGVMEKDHWKLGRMSQEHGILTTDSKSQELKLPEIGEYLQLVPQHACLTAACHTWFLITDDGKTVSEVWEAVKGW